MLEALKKLFAPMNIAAYIAWVGIGVEIWFGRPLGTGLLAPGLVAPEPFV